MQSQKGHDHHGHDISFLFHLSAMHIPLLDFWSCSLGFTHTLTYVLLRALSDVINFTSPIYIFFEQYMC